MIGQRPAEGQRGGLERVREEYEECVRKGFGMLGVPDHDIEPHDNVHDVVGWILLGRVIQPGAVGVRVPTYIPIRGGVLRTPRFSVVYHLSQTRERRRGA